MARAGMMHMSPKTHAFCRISVCGSWSGLLERHSCVAVDEMSFSAPSNNVIVMGYPKCEVVSSVRVSARAARTAAAQVVSSEVMGLVRTDSDVPNPNNPRPLQLNLPRSPCIGLGGNPAVTFQAAIPQLAVGNPFHAPVAHDAVGPGPDQSINRESTADAGDHGIHG